MKTYRVGGSVRDQLLGLPVQDRDYVVVGATPEAMVAKGFKPVGADFPVFLHPDTREEYALARTERKSGTGYKGFTIHASPEVTLEEDLARRDLTINAMAMDEAGNLVDPYGGRRDIDATLLRHVGPAFAEDPVRILRVARFAARFADRGFRVAEDTLALMQGMVQSGEADHLVAERVWQEMAKGLVEARPDAMVDVLQRCGALARIGPELAQATIDLQLLRETGGHPPGVEARFAALCLGLDPDAAQQLCDRWKVPAACRDLALAAIRATPHAARLESLRPAELLELFDLWDALRRPHRAEALMELLARQAARLRPPSAAGVEDSMRLLSRALARLQSLDLGAVAQAAAGKDIPSAIRDAKLHALQSFLNEQKGNMP